MIVITTAMQDETDTVLACLTGVVPAPGQASCTTLRGGEPAPVRGGGAAPLGLPLPWCGARSRPAKTLGDSLGHQLVAPRREGPIAPEIEIRQCAVAGTEVVCERIEYGHVLHALGQEWRHGQPLDPLLEVERPRRPRRQREQREEGQQDGGLAAAAAPGPRNSLLSGLHVDCSAS